MTQSSKNQHADKSRDAKVAATQRLADALRANLRRRKAATGRDGSAVDAGSGTAAEPAHENER